MRIASLLLGLCVAPVATATPYPAPMPAPVLDTALLPCPFEAGTTHTWGRSATGTMGSVTSTVTLAVVSADEASIVVDVDSKLTKVRSNDPVMEQLLPAFDAIDVKPRVQFDRATVALSVTNLQALQPKYAAAGAAVADALVLDGAPEGIRGAVLQLAGSAELLEQSVVRDLVPLFGFTCGPLTMEATEYETQLPSPFGGGVVPAKGVLVAKRGEGGEVLVRNDEVLDPAALQADALRAMTAMAGSLDADPSLKAQALQLLEDVPVEAETTMQATVDTKTGWVTTVRSGRVVSAPGQQRVDQVELISR